MSIPSLLQEVAAELQAVDRVQSGGCPDYITGPEKEVIDRAHEAGYTHLDTGTDRVVLALDSSTVVKLARPSAGGYNGRRANDRESSQYRSASADVQELLAPVHAVGSNNTWLTMERATEIRGYEHEIPEGFHEDCKERGVNTLGDALIWNVGYIPSKGRDCFIDYGHSIL